MQYLKGADYTEKDWKDESPSGRYLELEAMSNDAPNDDELSVPGK